MIYSGLRLTEMVLAGREGLLARVMANGGLTSRTAWVAEDVTRLRGEVARLRGEGAPASGRVGDAASLPPRREAPADAEAEEIRREQMRRETLRYSAANRGY